MVQENDIGWLFRAQAELHALSSFAVQELEHRSEGKIA